MNLSRFKLLRRFRSASQVLVYAAIIAAALFVADQRTRSAGIEASRSVPATEETRAADKPFFSLLTTRTYATSENARLWLDHRGVESLDFRVYRVNDPQKFFAQLSNPHQMGEDEKEQVAPSVSRKPSLLEDLRAIKAWTYAGI